MEEKNTETNLIVTRFLNKYTTFDFFKDIINVYLYPSDFSMLVGSTNQDTFPKYVEKFFRELQRKLQQYNCEGKQRASGFIETINRVNQLRNSGKGVITYKNIDQHLTSDNALIKKLVQSAKQEQIKSEEEFRAKTNQINLFIQYFYDFQAALDGFTKIHEYVSLLEKPETSPIEAVESFKDMALQIENSVTQLCTATKEEASVDYYILSDKSSVSSISDSITDYLCNNYSFFNTGLKAYDESVAGFESSSVHIVASPSNGGKSITLANLLYRIAVVNKEEFKPNDAALYITCEDDLIKTTRKFMSIFGNYDFTDIREIYKSVHEYINKIKKSNDDEVDKESKNQIKQIFLDVLQETITKSTQGTIKIIFKYSPESSLSAGMIETAIKKFAMQGITIKYLIIDYLDVLKPTLGGNNLDEQMTLGIITQELRTLSRIFGIPVITASQTKREGDNIGQTLVNTMMGESWKKVKFSDFIYMQRMREDLNVFSPDVEKCVFTQTFTSENPQVQQLRDDLLTTLKPLEVRVSKSKEQGKGYYRFMLFSSRNLRLYNSIEEYLKDLPELEGNSRQLKKKITKINQMTELSIPQEEEDNQSSFEEIFGN